MPRLDVEGRFKMKVLPSNTYIVQAKTGNFQVALPLEVIDGEHAGKTITYFKAITDNTIDDLAARLAEVFGYDGGLHNLYEGNCPFIGAECSLTTKQDGYDEKGHPKIVAEWLNPAGGGGFKKPAEGEFNAFMTRFGGRFQAVAGAALKTLGREPITAPPKTEVLPSRANGEQSPKQEDELPF